MIFAHHHFKKDLQLEADLCVVGSGAGGSPVVHEAAKKGKKVIVVEAGSFWRPKDFSQLEHEMFPRLYQESAARATTDKAIHVHQGKGLGGSTLHNLNLCARVPKEIEAQWRAKDSFSALPPEKLKALYEEVESFLPVSQLSEKDLSANNRVFKKGIDALGYRGGFLKHNRQGCAGSGFCELGCPFDAKQNAMKSFLAPAVDNGAMVLTDTWGVKLHWSQRKVHWLEALVREPGSGKQLFRVRIKAKAFCVSASATGTATLLQRSEIPDPFRLIGSRLYLHPGVAVAGLFEQQLQSWKGIPQGYECTEFLEFHEGSNKRAWIIPAFAHPIGVSSILSGFGEQHSHYMKDYSKLAALTAMIHDQTSGYVRPKGAFGVALDYWSERKDREQMLLGLKECARILLAAGAKKAIIPLNRTIELTKIADIEKAFPEDIERHMMNITAVHPMGTVWMGDDQQSACVHSSGRYHHVDNLFIADTSLYPSSIGAPPQLTAYALGLHVGRQILDFMG